MSTVVDGAGEIFNNNSRALAPAAVGSQVALMSIVSVRNIHQSLVAHSYGDQAVTILFFNILRPSNKVY